MAQEIEVTRISGRSVFCVVEAFEDQYAWVTDPDGGDDFVAKRRLGAWQEIAVRAVLRRLNAFDSVAASADVARDR